MLVSAALHSLNMLTVRQTVAKLLPYNLIASRLWTTYFMYWNEYVSIKMRLLI